MHWLLDLLLDVILAFIPWETHGKDRSVMGESRMDKQSRWITWTVLLLISLGLILFTYLT